MKMIRLLLGLATLLGATIIAVPASAEFRGTNGASQGSLSFPATTELDLGSTVVRCLRGSGASQATGEWHIQTSEETVVNNATKGGGTKEQKQPLTSKGPHEDITISKWGECTAEVGEAKLGAKVSACRLQFKQVPGSTKIPSTAKVASVQTDCVIVISSGETVLCTLVVEQTKANHELEGIVAENSPPDQVLVKANVKGVTGVSSGASCKTAGVPAITKGYHFATGVEGSEAINLHGQQLV